MLTLVALCDPRRTRSQSHEPSREFSASCRAQHSVLEIVKFRGSSLHLQTGKPREPGKHANQCPGVLSTTRRCEIARQTGPATQRGRLPALQRPDLPKIMTPPTLRPHQQRRLPERVRDQVHQLVLDLQLAGHTDEVRGCDQHARRGAGSVAEGFAWRCIATP